MEEHGAAHVLCNDTALHSLLAGMVTANRADRERYRFLCRLGERYYWALDGPHVGSARLVTCDIAWFWAARSDLRIGISGDSDDGRLEGDQPFAKSIAPIAMLPSRMEHFGNAALVAS